MNEGSAHYKYHVEHYGHPSKFGYKDIIPLWKAERWEPDRLMRLYKKAGAKYFCVIAEHHDNFDCWNSKFHGWNSVNLGPKRDITGEWQQAARKYGPAIRRHRTPGGQLGLVQSHQEVRYEGPAGRRALRWRRSALRRPLSCAGNEKPKGWYCGQRARRCSSRSGSIGFRISSTRYQPDLLYSDGPLPYPDEVGRKLLAHFYNANCTRHGGQLEAVYTCKQDSRGSWVQDLERGVMDEIRPEPWQTDTCVGGWYYDVNLPRRHGYKSAATVIRMLADIVSKNGNLLLNFPPRPDGTLGRRRADDPRRDGRLDDRQRRGDLRHAAVEGLRRRRGKVQGGNFNEDGLRYTAADIRFTTKGDTLYAIALGWPESGKLVVRSLAAPAGHITGVTLARPCGQARLVANRRGAGCQAARRSSRANMSSC